MKRFHAHLPVANLADSIRFRSAVSGEPAQGGSACCAPATAVVAIPAPAASRGCRA
jgi:hypothetical protein